MDLSNTVSLRGSLRLPRNDSNVLRSPSEQNAKLRFTLCQGGYQAVHLLFGADIVGFADNRLLFCF